MSSTGLAFPLFRQTYFQPATWNTSDAAPASPSAKQHAAPPLEQRAPFTVRMSNCQSPTGFCKPLLLPQLDVNMAPSRDEGPPSESVLKRQKFAMYEKHCSKVAEGLYVSGEAVAKSLQLLRESGITHVVNCVGQLYPEFFKADGIVYKTFWLLDSPSEDILCVLYDAFEFIDAARTAGGRVLVHCSQGVSRSTTIAIAYLMWRMSQPYDDVYNAVRALRGVCSPNIGFTCQLLQWQKRRSRPPTRVRVYRLVPHCADNPMYIVPKAVSPAKGAVFADWRALDPRGAFVVHVPGHLYVWRGHKCPEKLAEAAHRAALLIQKYEATPAPEAVRQGEEPEELVLALHPPSASELHGDMSIEPSAASLTGAGGSAMDDLRSEASMGSSFSAAPSAANSRPSSAHWHLAPQFGGSGGQHSHIQAPWAASRQASINSHSGVHAEAAAALSQQLSQQQLGRPGVVAEVDGYTEEYEMFHRAFARTSGVEGLSGRVTPRHHLLPGTLDPSSNRADSPASIEGRGRKYRRSDSESCVMSGSKPRYSLGGASGRFSQGGSIQEAEEAQQQQQGPGASSHGGFLE